MKGDFYAHSPEGELIIQEYIRNAESPKLSNQIDAVYKFITHRWDKGLRYAIHSFIVDFPESLFQEFKRMCNTEFKVENYFNKKILIFDVFTFIFRRFCFQNISEFTALPFVLLFLKHIEIPQFIKDYDITKLIKSISVCIAYDPIKIMFINENGIYNLYNYFKSFTVKQTKILREIVEQIYDLEPFHRSSLSILKIEVGLDILLKSYRTSPNEDFKRLILNVLKMLDRCGFSDECRYDVNLFYDVTIITLLQNSTRSKKKYSLCLKDFSKIWIGILNGSKYLFKIDRIDKLLYFAALFSFDLFRKIDNVTRYSNLKVTKSISQQFYIMYLSLVTFPIHTECYNKLLKTLLNELHTSFQQYIEKKLISKLSIENQFLILQYYIKSAVTLNIKISSSDYEYIDMFFKMQDDIPSLSYFH
ncbi:hypothetical protein RF11_07460 [Thelohanellus kitauei]|uniref:Uncharacterized protein n=1 Tax=Thelohanellus kitauei TaxID=669202 RepID=A0A0C2JDZ8_THEKT|nr:hypothetical protein RF11_07460 [Thelohanellus kitauei]